MSEAEASAKQAAARKGTKSCTECRRRKIRCIRTPEDAEICRSCEDRRSQCVAQTYSARPLRTPGLPSRHRISQLEVEVASLRKAVRGIQSKLGYQAVEIEPASAQPSPSPGDGDSEEDSNASDVLATEQPSHLRSLFQNDWLSADVGGQDEQMQDRKAKAATQLLDTARKTLQRLIPSKEDVFNIAKTASKWLELVAAILAQPFGLNTQQELIDSYDDMLKPDVDTMTLAAWLLDLAVTVQQEPEVHGSPATSLKRFHRASDFCRAVSEAVETTLISHDRLLGTIQGLGMAMHFLRLHISQGNFQKAWIEVRHCITIAELLGLSKSPRNFPSSNSAQSGTETLQAQKVRLWEFMCSAERLSGMVINKPPTSRRLDQPHAQPLVVNGVVQTHVYLKRLTDITAKFYTLDDPSATQGGNDQAYASAIELDRELRVLSSQTSRSWWEQDMTQVKPENLCQLLHYYFLMRVHLPFTMRQNSADGNAYSRLTCMEACEAVAQRYQALRRMLPSGIFLSPMLDLQALTATVVLLLSSHSGPANDRVDVQANKLRVQDIAAQVLKVMEERSRDGAGSTWARQGALTIRALHGLLQDGGETTHSGRLSLKVPILGNINVRRNSGHSEMAAIKTQQSAQGLPGMGLWRPDTDLGPHSLDVASLNQAQLGPSSVQEQTNWQWNPLSWSIEENNDNVFQDAFMADNFDQFGNWEGGYNNFQFSN